MTAFDHSVLVWLNALVNQSATLDQLVYLIANNPLFKGVPVALLFWFLWFWERNDVARRRRRLVATVIVAVVAIGVGRGLALLLPHRARPLHASGLDLDLPTVVPPGALDGWSSFPSDHAVLFFALATSFWLINRTAGLLAVVHAVLVIGFARVYLTFHYPTDILGGLVIGVGLSLLLMAPVSRWLERHRWVERTQRRPELFYPVLFLVIFQMATMFNSARQTLSVMKDVIL